MSFETKLIVAAMTLDVLWVVSLTYVVWDAARRSAPRLRWGLITILTGPIGLAYWLVIRKRHPRDPFRG